MTHRVTIAKLRAAEPARWPGYADEVIGLAHRHGRVEADAVVLPADVYDELRARSAARLTFARVAHGVAGIARALTGTGGATAATVDARSAVCGTCFHAQLVGGVLSQCRLCGCATWAKIRNAAESCPDRPPRWGRQPDA